MPPQRSGLQARHDFRNDPYGELVAWLDDLIAVVGNDENHPLAWLMDVIGTLIESYEDFRVAARTGFEPVHRP